jgi:hypothetical protein
MNELKDFQPVQLMTLLAEETISYYKLVGYGASVEECTQCNDRIKEIRSELDSRREKENEHFLHRPYVDVAAECAA